MITTNGTYPWLLASMKVFYEFWYGKIAIKKNIYPGILSDLTFKIVPFSHIFKASDGFWKTVRPIMFFEKSTD